jgi:hypothetical protein
VLKRALPVAESSIGSISVLLSFGARTSNGSPRLTTRALTAVARQTNGSVARPTEWRDRALAGAAMALKERERDEDEIARLKSKLGEIIMDNELLFAKIAATR